MISACLSGCGGGAGQSDGSPERDASLPDAGQPDAERPDAGRPDAGAPPTALVFVDVSDHAPPLGGTTTVTWQSRDATECELSVDNQPIASGVSGSEDITVSQLSLVTVACLPFGPASVARMPVAPACEATVSVDALDVIFDGQVLDGNGDPFLFAPGDCIDVTGGVSFSGQNDELAAQLRSAGSIFEMIAGTHGNRFARLESAGTIALDYCNGGSSSYVFPVLGSLGGTLTLLDGRADLRAIPGPSLFIRDDPLDPGTAPPLVVDTQATLGALSIIGRDNLPVFTGPIAQVLGDVRIRDTRVPRARIDELVSTLGAIAGTIQICGNLDDAPCP